MLKATALIAGSLLLGTASLAVAEPQQFAQAQMQNRSQMEQDYQNRLNAARTPEERARIQAEWDRARQQGAVPGAVPGTGANTDPAAPRNPSVPGGPGQSEQLNYPNQPNQGDQGKGG